MRNSKIWSILATVCVAFGPACDAPPTSPEAEISRAGEADAVDAGPQLGILDGSRAGIVLTGPASDAGPHVKAFDVGTTQEVHSFFAFAPSFTGGVRVALGDVTGDGLADIVTAAGPGAGPHVRVFSGATGAELMSFFAFAPSFTGGVFVAAGDVDGDGRADIVTGAGGGPHVRVFSGATGAELMSFFAFAESFTSGVRVASGDVNGDGHADIITAAGPGGGPHVKVFDGATGRELSSFFAYAPTFTGGVFVGSGDVNGDGLADIVTGAGPGGGPHVKVLDGATGRELSSFFAYAESFTGGVTVSAGDVNDDGLADVITGAGAGGGPHVKVFDGATGDESTSFFAYDAAFQGGVFVAGGSPGERDPIPIIDDLVTAAEEAVSQGTLVGTGPGRSGLGRLNAWMSMLSGARAKLQSADVDGACANLFNTHRRADGAPRPPDFVEGPATRDLADRIRELGEDLGCGFPGPVR